MGGSGGGQRPSPVLLGRSYGAIRSGRLRRSDGPSDPRSGTTGWHGGRSVWGARRASRLGWMPLGSGPQLLEARGSGIRQLPARPGSGRESRPSRSLCTRRRSDEGDHVPGKAGPVGRRPQRSRSAAPLGHSRGLAPWRLSARADGSDRPCPKSGSVDSLSLVNGSLPATGEPK